METVFSSAFLLYIIDAVSPGFVPDQTWLPSAHSIFDMMISRGSPAAPLRKRELQRLEQIMTSYLACSQINNECLLQADENFMPSSEGDASESGLARYMEHMESPGGLLGVNGGLIMSPGEIIHLAEELQLDDFFDAS